jgi:hypothetical protein
MIHARTHRIARGMDLTTACLYRKSRSYSSLSLVPRLVSNNRAIITFLLLMLFSVWCWGWDGAGDLDGPDVEPIWEAMPNRTTLPEAVKIKHDRGLEL